MVVEWADKIGGTHLIHSLTNDHDHWGAGGVELVDMDLYAIQCH